MLNISKQVHGGGTLCPEIFRSLKGCYPEEEKMPLPLSGGGGERGEE